MYMPYIKKSDAKKYLQKTHKYIGVLFASIGATIAVVYYLVAPNIHNIFQDLAVDNPTTLIQSKYSAYVAAGTAFLISAYYMLTKPDLDYVEKILKKYKNNDMILTKELVNTNQTWILVTIAIVLTLLFVYAIYSPVASIYSVTETF